MVLWQLRALVSSLVSARAEDQEINRVDAGLVNATLAFGYITLWFCC